MDKIETSILSRRIQWEGDVSAVDQWLPDGFFSVPVHFSNQESPDDLISVIFLNQSGLSLKTARAIPKIYIKDKFLDSELKHLLSLDPNSYFFSISEPTDKFRELILQLFSKSLQRSQKSLYYRASLAQTKEIEQLNSGLEQIVQSQTQDILNSHEEERSKMLRERQLIHFLNQLSGIVTFEEVLIFLKKETKKFHGLGDIYLIIFNETEQKTDFYFLKNSHFVHRTDRSKIDSSEIFEHYLSSRLATVLGRPLRSTQYLELQLVAAQKISGIIFKGFLGLEYTSSRESQAQLLDYMAEKQGSISLALDRIYLEDWLRSETEAWVNTFDQLRHPIAIIGSDYQVHRANKMFMNSVPDSKNEKCYEVFAKRKSPCEECPIKEGASGLIQSDRSIFQSLARPIHIQQEDTKNFVIQYIDVSKERQIYLQMIQNEKVQAMGGLAGHIAHELNNPLTGIRSLAQVLSRSVPDGSSLQSDFVEIEKAATRSQKIIQNLQNFTMGTNNDLLTVSFKNLIDDTIPFLKSVLRNHSYQIIIEAENDLILVESQLMQQVIFNLVNNACQAIPEKGLIQLKLTQSSEDNIALEVADNGPGISDDLKDRIFNPFFTTKKEGLGTGLGLSLSRTIVEKYGGTLTCVSSPLGGACFRVELPLAKGKLK